MKAATEFGGTYVAVLVLHIIGALTALVSGFVAPYRQRRTRWHRPPGKLCIAGWLTLVACGVVIDGYKPGLGNFWPLSLGDMSFVGAGYGAILFRRRIGRYWLRVHYSCRLFSMNFVFIATGNQVLPIVWKNYWDTCIT